MTRISVAAIVVSLTALTGVAHCDEAAGGVRLPAVFEHDRVLVMPKTADGHAVRFYTDTGGGWNAIGESAVERLGLSPLPGDEGESARPMVAFPEFAPGTSIPAPANLDGHLVVVADGELTEDGFLGRNWHADRVWDFDYPNRTLRLLGKWDPDDVAEYRVPLGFQVDQHGERTTHFPRMSFSVDGESFDMLLDTGARAQLTEEAAARLELPAGTHVGTSFITRSVFEKWVSAHPEWEVIARGDEVRGSVFPMIRVPQVTIGVHAVGPVWFAQRPDGSFHEYMAQWMDRPADGALGGSAFRYFRMIIDYPDAAAYFLLPGR